MSVETTSPEASYLTKPNIVHPEPARTAYITALETRARAEISERRGVSSVSGGSIKRSN